jgi:hypothetical protein
MEERAVHAGSSSLAAIAVHIRTLAAVGHSAVEAVSLIFRRAHELIRLMGAQGRDKALYLEIFQGQFFRHR